MVSQTGVVSLVLQSLFCVHSEKIWKKFITCILRLHSHLLSSEWKIWNLAGATRVVGGGMIEPLLCGGGGGGDLWPLTFDLWPVTFGLWPLWPTFEVVTLHPVIFNEFCPAFVVLITFGYELAGAPRRASGGRWAFGLRSELLWVCAINKVINQPIRTRPINQSTNQKSRFPNPRWPPI